ncbi:RAP domain-containing protein chloroplastic, partial [Bienertia sinuspersici]
LTFEAHEQEKNPESSPSAQKDVDDEYYRWYDCRPDSPIPLKDLIPSSGSEHSDPSYQLLNEHENVLTESDGSDLEVEEFGYDLEHENEAFEEDGFDSTDDELREARERNKKTNAELFEISQQVQREAVAGASLLEEGRIDGGDHVQVDENGYLSDYANSEEDELTPDEDSDGERNARRRRGNRMVVSDGTDWTTFEWRVGHRFPNRKSFKDAVARYAIFQGRNLSVVLSDKKRGQRLGVKCLPGCNFSLYASWDSATNCFIVKSVKSGHSCVRNMEKNKQLKSTWMAQQFLEIFKARPHWPAKDIIETVKRAYKVIIKKDLAYKVKYQAHRMLHGSMKEHYMKSILAAVSKVLPKAEHRHCARHIYAHWHKTFRGDEFKQLFWRAAKAYNMADFNDALEDMGKVNSQSVDAFKSYNPRLFCRAFMNTDMKVDVIVNNLAETFNGYIISARTKHLLYMLEEIRTALMQRLAMKNMEMEKTTTLICPRIQAKLEKAKKESAECNVVPSTRTIFQVSQKMDVVSVDLEARTCTCRVWDLTGIPCSHAISCIFFCHKNAENYVSHWYTKETYARSYAVSIPPCVGERHWPKVDLPLIPPPIKIGPGRPRKNRIKDPFEDPKKPGKLTKHGVKMTCSICKSNTHNKRTCPNKGKEGGEATNVTKSKRQRVEGDGGLQMSQTGESSSVLDATAQPTRTGKGRRVIRGGKGYRGGSRGRGRGNGRGYMISEGESTECEGKSRGRRRGSGGSTSGNSAGSGRGRGNGGDRGRGRRIPQGFGVFVTEDGTTVVNAPGQSRPREVTQSASTVNWPIGTQSSTAI